MSTNREKGRKIKYYSFNHLILMHLALILVCIGTYNWSMTPYLIRLAVILVCVVTYNWSMTSLYLILWPVCLKQHLTNPITNYDCLRFNLLPCQT